jgi:hypothetical protein
MQMNNSSALGAGTNSGPGHALIGVSLERGARVCATAHATIATGAIAERVTAGHTEVFAEPTFEQMATPGRADLEAAEEGACFGEDR